MSWATLPITTLSACLLEVSSVRAATRASRRVEVWPIRWVSWTSEPRAVPGAPLAHDELDPVALVELAHDLPMVADELLHAVRPLQKGLPVPVIELDGVACGAAVVVQRPAVHPVQELAPVTVDRHLAEEPPGPVDAAGRVAAAVGPYSLAYSSSV